MNKAMQIQNKISYKILFVLMLASFFLFGIISTQTTFDYQLRIEKTSGKNEPHASQQAKEAAKQKYQQLKKEYQQLKQKPKKTPNDKKRLIKIANQLKRLKQKTDFKGETHSKKGKGYK